MRREAMMRTCRSENFFSSSRVRLQKSISIGMQGVIGNNSVRTAAETYAIQREEELGRR